MSEEDLLDMDYFLNDDDLDEEFGEEGFIFLIPRSSIVLPAYRRAFLIQRAPAAVFPISEKCAGPFTFILHIYYITLFSIMSNTYITWFFMLKKHYPETNSSIPQTQDIFSYQHLLFCGSPYRGCLLRSHHPECPYSQHFLRQ